MDFCFIRFMLTLVVTGQVSGLPLACSYNGTAYADGEIIATEEPCLSCVCRRGSLTCNLRVCADTPDILEPGCFLVHKANDCCPQLLCEETYSHQNGVELRTGFKTESTIVENGCFINGSIYAEGSAVASSQLCEYCYCVKGEMKCIKPRCFQPFEGCKALYREPSCCPTHYDCRNLAVRMAVIKDDYGCESDGVYYHDGEMVNSSNSSKCENCYCMKGKIMCAPIICSMSIFEDCEPVNSPGQCCPTSFACKKPPSTVSNSSSENLSTLSPEIDKNTDVTESITEVEERTPELEIERKVEEARIEESAVTEETEGATHSKEREFVDSTENDNDTGFQAIGSINASTEVTTMLMDKTTIEPPTTPSSDSLLFMSATAGHEEVPEVDIQTDINFGDLRGVSGGHTTLDEIVANSSQSSEDYDAYDYSEPILPPSLPNLVIFPFVAADAVVRDESTTKSEFHQESIKRIDTQPVFYKDYFSPPAQTEGGFVPKEPAPSHKPLYHSSYFGKENTSPGANSEVGTKTITHITIPPRVQNEAIFPQFMENPLVVMAAQGIPIVTPDPFGDFIRTDSTPNLKSMDDLNSFPGNYQTTKPVTVTYKNVIVDFYPDYLVTTTRNSFRENPSESLTKDNIRKHIYVSASGESEKRYSSVIVSTTHEPQYSFKRNESESERTPFTVFPINPTETTTNTTSTTAHEETKTTEIFTTSESSFFDEFLKTFLSEDPKPTFKTSPKYKYSSKIKGPATTTVKPNVEDVTQNVKVDYNSSTSSYSFFDFLFDSESSETSSPILQKVNKTKLYTTPKPVKGGNKRPTKIIITSTAKPHETKTENVQTFNSKRETELQNKPSHPENRENSESKANLGGLLKLAGCNIYGRMYRVGKIILELSGPCLECVCADLGVQCKQLSC